MLQYQNMDPLPWHLARCLFLMLITYLTWSFCTQNIPRDALSLSILIPGGFHTALAEFSPNLCCLACFPRLPISLCAHT